MMEVLRGRLSPAAGDRPVDSGSRVLRWPESVRSFYQAREYAPVWYTDDGFEARSQALRDVIRSAGRHGLPSERYHLRLIENAARLPYEQYTAAGRADIELLFSDGLLGYAGDLLKGRARGVELKGSRIDATEEVDINDIVNAALSAGQLQQVVWDLEPLPAAYARLRNAAVRLRSTTPPGRPFQLPERTLRAGDSGGEIAALRRWLAFFGDLPSVHDDNRGLFDEPLVEAVRRFQFRHGLAPDGEVGPGTRAALSVPISRRLEQIELNLERWRWLPREPGTRYVIVNIAGPDLQVVENGGEALQMRVVMNGPFPRTASFASNIEAVVLNPYRDVPHSVAVNEILPAVRRDPGYLAREDMQVLDRSAGGRSVDPATIDWSRVSARDFPYRFRQRPGSGNAFGRAEFVMSNPYSVHLHGAPGETLSPRARRCFSHGCVGLEKPVELAGLLLHDEPDWSLERLHATLETEHSHRVQLTRPTPVYLVYWTAWVDNEGIIHFREDAHGRDERLRAALGEANP